MISIFIPVYRRSDNLEPLLQRLLSDPFAPKEIFVAVDEPDQSVLDTMRRFPSVNFQINPERKGKVGLLRQAVAVAMGELFLFIDSDIQLPPSKEENSFLETIAGELRKAEIVDVKKKVRRDSTLARLVHYDFLASNAISWLFSRSGNCLGLGGAAFAITRETYSRVGGFRRRVSEDLEIAVQAFANGCSFRYSAEAEVLLVVSNKWSDWYRQRKRWSAGGAIWIKEHSRLLFRSMLRKPHIVLPTLALGLPTLSTILIALVLLEAFPGLSFLSAGLASFAAVALVHYAFARKHSFHFNPLEFFLYCFVYSPIWIAIMAAGILRVMIYGPEISLDWKV